MNLNDEVERPWTAKSAWFALLAMPAAILCLVTVTMLGSTMFHRSLALSPPRRALVALLFGLFPCVVAVYLSRVRSPSEFTRRFGLTPRPSQEFFAALGGGALLQFVSIGLVPGGLSNLAWRTSWNWGIPVVLLTVMGGEIILRGFIYPAFRGSYSRRLSVVILVLVSLAASGRAIFESFPAIVSTAALTWIACELRERFDNTWLPITFHLGYALLGVATNVSDLSKYQG